jgi:hypothetical protein
MTATESITGSPEQVQALGQLKQCVLDDGVAVQVVQYEAICQEMKKYTEEVENCTKLSEAINNFKTDLNYDDNGNITEESIRGKCTEFGIADLDTDLSGNALRKVAIEKLDNRVKALLSTSDLKALHMRQWGDKASHSLMQAIHMLQLKKELVQSMYRH